MLHVSKAHRPVLCEFVLDGLVRWSTCLKLNSFETQKSVLATLILTSNLDVLVICSSFTNAIFEYCFPQGKAYQGLNSSETETESIADPVSIPDPHEALNVPYTLIIHA